MAIIDRGGILLEAEPLAAIARLRGRIWRRVVARDELPTLTERYAVISTKLLGGPDGRPRAAPTRARRGFEPAEPDLEDVYFSHAACRAGTAARAGGADARADGARVRQFSRLELGDRYYLRRVSTWIYFGIFVVIASSSCSSRWRAYRDASAAAAARCMANSPSRSRADAVIALFGMSIVAAFVGQRRSSATTTRRWSRSSTRRRSASRLPRRALHRHARGQRVVLLGVVVGLMLGRQMPWVEPDKSARSTLAPYLQPFLALVLPNLLLHRRDLLRAAGAHAADGADLRRRRAAPRRLSHGGQSRSRPGRRAASARCSTRSAFARSAIDDAILDDRRPEHAARAALAACSLWNRVIWLAVALAVLAIAYVRFRFSYARVGAAGGSADDAATVASASAPALAAPCARSDLPRRAQRFDGAGASASTGSMSRGRSARRAQAVLLRRSLGLGVLVHARRRARRSATDLRHRRRSRSPTRWSIAERQLRAVHARHHRLLRGRAGVGASATRRSAEIATRCRCRT